MNPVVRFEIYVQDMARAKVFYETVLGIELSRIGQIDDSPHSAIALGTTASIFGTVTKQRAESVILHRRKS